MAYCRECGGDVGAGDRFCQHCGARLGGDTTRDQGQGQGYEHDQGQGQGYEHDQGQGRGYEHDQGQGQGYEQDQEWGQDSGQGRVQNQGQGQGYEEGRRGASHAQPGEHGGHKAQPGEHGGHKAQPGHERGPGDPQTGPAAGHEQGQPTETGPPQEQKDGIDFAFSYPISDDWGPLVVSGLLLLGSFLIVPGLALLGYGYRVSRAAALGWEEPPGYENWGGLIVDGLRFSAVSFGIAIALLIPYGIVIGLARINGLLGLLIIPLFFLSYYVAPAALMTFVGTDEVVAPFTSGHTVALLRSTYYFKAFLFAWLLSFVLNLLINLLLLTIVGWIWGIAFSVLSFGAFWGYIYYRAAQKGIVPPAEGTLGDGPSRPQGPQGPQAHPADDPKPPSY